MFGNPLLLADEGYQISRSVRLRSSASAYFNRTPASAGNRKTWTWSAWFKRGTFTAYHHLFSSYVGSGASDSNYFRVFIPNVGADQDKIVIGGAATNWRVTTQVFRDPSAWYHLIIAADTTQATANNRFRVYLNGSEITSFSTLANPTQNFDMGINQAAAHYIGSEVAGSNLFDGYLTEINFIDGQALTPSSFGETDAITGVWKPKKYAGTYGTNGFYLNFSDPSAATAAAIGKDYSGNGNNWTPNNISVTSGATYDSMMDVPTPWADGGNGRGNYAVLNPLRSSTGTTVTNGNLDVTTSSSTTGSILASIGMSSGKWYWECVQTATTVSSVTFIGIAQDNASLNNTLASTSTGYAYVNSGLKVNAGSATAYGASFTNGDVIGVAFDADAGTITFYKNNVSQGVAYSSIPAGTYFPGISDNGTSETSSVTANFGQRPFAYTPPSGFKALNTLNLPEPTIKKGNSYFDATTYTGTGANQSIVNSGSMQPDLVWLKTRNTVSSNLLYDSSRGVLNYLSSNQTAAEASLANSLTAFNSNGFSLGSDGNVNGNGTTFVGWQWKEGATQGFDIVTYTGDSAASRSISHSLGVAPKMIIAKIRSTVNGWPVWHTSLGATGYLILNQTQAASTNSAIWNSAPTSTTFAVGNNGLVNASGETYVAYLFAEVAGFSKFGSYTGNGSADGPFVFCGFRPRYVLIKQSDAATNWIVMDSARSPTNTIPDFLLPNESNAESTSSASNIDFTSNGFKIRNSNSDRNTNGSTYIFAAFAETPFRYALAR